MIIQLFYLGHIFSSRIHNLIPGKISNWFLILENIILSNTTTCHISSSLYLSNTNSLLFQTDHFNSKSKPWLISYLENKIIIGKARRFNHTTNTISITYWNIQTN